MIESLLAVACFLYFVEYAWFFVGTLRLRRLDRGGLSSCPPISILVAARNEGAYIERCLEALAAQDYPTDLAQIIAVNDESDDDTLHIMQEVSRRHGGRIEVISTVNEETHARGKARAIAQGVDRATGEIILLTDGDCTPPTTWASAAVDHFVPGVDAYGGFTLVTSGDLFSAVQQLDWLHLHTLAAAGIAWNVPLGIIGNNLAFRRSAYEAVGGYRTVRFTVTEDFALIRAIHRSGGKVIFACSRDTCMVTQPCSSLGEVLRQKQRWSRGGRETGLPGWAVLIVAVLMMAALVVAPFVSTTWWFVVWGTKFACDLAVMMPTLQRLGRMRQLRYFLLFEFYFIAQALVVPFLLMNRTVVWKGRAYRS